MKLLLINAKPLLADALATQGGVNVAALWPRKHDFTEILASRNVRSLSYCGGSKLDLRAIREVRQIIGDLRPDVIHAFYGRALAHATLGTTAFRNRPKIVSFRGITSPLGWLDAGNWVSYRHPSVDAHACESDAVREAMIGSGIRADRCATIYNSMSCWTAKRPGRAALKQFGIPEGAFVVGTVAAMRHVKGIDLLLQAALQCADLRDVYWVLFGRVMDQAIPRLAEDPRIRERVRLVGHRPDASELISGADLFVLPSRAEALGQALLEAMHQRVCPIVSSAGGMKEVVRHEQDGLVVPTEDVDALATAIRRLHADRTLVSHFAASAQERISSSFTPTNMAERSMAIYHQLLGTSPLLAAA